MIAAQASKPASLLVIGAARSGKSRFAQTLAEKSGRRPLLVATAQAHDAEMAAKIEKHRRERGDGWALVEEPQELVPTLQQVAQAGTIAVVDCLTLWLSNLLFAERDLDAEGDALAAAVAGLAGPVIFVSNEVGAGIVPETALGRRFRDAQGRLNQKIAKACATVVLVAAGLPLVLKPAPDVEIAL